MSATLAEGLQRLATLLADEARPCALIGGGAMIARVRSRPTKDLDIVLVLAAGELDRFLQAAARHGYGWDPADRPLMEEGLIRLWTPPGREAGVGLDVIVADSPFLRELVQRATPVHIDDLVLPCASLEDLVLLKLEANRPIDVDDVLAIKDAFADRLDMAFLRAQADALDLRGRLDLYFS